MELEWYELHDCLGCGLRIQIGGPPDSRFITLEPKSHYNERHYHDEDCEALARRKAPTHGTTWGYKLCSERPEGACEDCRAFNTEKQRPRQSAHGKALRRLGRMFPSKLEEFIQEEMDG
jgi:hypothetical protein